MIYGYARVSTKGQERDGNSLEVQERLLKENGAVKVYCDSFTGTKKHRPELDKLISELKSGDTMVVTKLDRMARSTTQGIELINELLDRNIKVNVLNLGMMDNSPNGKLIRTIFLAFAEFERDMISDRTTEGKAEKRRNDPNFKEGRPRLIVEGFNEMCEKVNDGQMTVMEAIKRLGISRTSWYKLIKENI